MCVGILREDELIRAKAQGVGNPIMAVGARTGRDGIHGASFASEDLSHDSDAKRPRVQVGDPFTEKLLLEATLELIASGHVVAMQDMGAAGLTSSSAEMAERGDVGVTIDTLKVPVRESGMTPYEILLSESQERMLVVAIKGREDEVRAILAKWDLTAEVIGEVIAEPVYRVTEGDRVVAEFPGTRLVTDCPQYHPEARESDAIVALRARDVHAIPDAAAGAELRVDAPPPARVADDREQALAVPAVRLHRAHQHGDRPGRAATPRCCASAAPPRASRSRRTATAATSISIRASGGRIAVAEAARNVACVGARPMAITNCLNFGNPTRPEIFFQFREALAGMGEACVALGTPVTGGNVSLYNESPAGAVYPTPTIGMVGLIEDVSRATAMEFRAGGRRDRPARGADRRDSARASTSPGSTASSPARRRRATWPASGRSSRRCTRASAPGSCTPRTTAARADSRWRSPSAASPNPLARHGAMVDLTVVEGHPVARRPLRRGAGPRDRLDERCRRRHRDREEARHPRARDRHGASRRTKVS